MKTFSKNIGENFTWKFCPIECAHLFHTRVRTFMTKYINCVNGILGCVEHYMCRYEVQHRLSLHAHIILWLHKNDLNHVTNDILAFFHTIYDETQKSFVKLLDLIESKIFRLIYRKQLQNCQKKSYKTKYGFPYVTNK
jgi:hypothetical protein